MLRVAMRNDNQRESNRKSEKEKYREGIKSYIERQTENA